jgi:hypothetical protein
MLGIPDLKPTIGEPAPAMRWCSPKANLLHGKELDGELRWPYKPDLKTNYRRTSACYEGSSPRANLLHGKELDGELRWSFAPRARALPCRTTRSATAILSSLMRR